MKKLQPRMVQIREVYKDDRQQQQELMKIYREEKLNPLAGCLPILIQIPVFFSIYKVLFVTIDMRHQPFFGWIQDLSRPTRPRCSTCSGCYLMMCRPSCWLVCGR